MGMLLQHRIMAASGGKSMTAKYQGLWCSAEDAVLINQLLAWVEVKLPHLYAAVAKHVLTFHGEAIHLQLNYLSEQRMGNLAVMLQASLPDLLKKCNSGC